MKAAAAARTRWAALRRRTPESRAAAALRGAASHLSSYVLMALAPSLSWLFVGRVISGITSASISTAFAYIADKTAPEQRAAMFGKIGVAFGAGFILGPALGGLLGDISPRLPFWLAAGLSFANWLYGLFILPESLPADRRAPFRWKSAKH